MFVSELWQNEHLWLLELSNRTQLRYLHLWFSFLTNSCLKKKKVLKHKTATAHEAACDLKAAEDGNALFQDPAWTSCALKTVSQSFNMPRGPKWKWQEIAWCEDKKGDLRERVATHQTAEPAGRGGLISSGRNATTQRRAYVLVSQEAAAAAALILPQISRKKCVSDGAQLQEGNETWQHAVMQGNPHVDTNDDLRDRWWSNKDITGQFTPAKLHPLARKGGGLGLVWRHFNLICW